MIAPAGDKLSASLSQGLSENICAVQSRGWSSKRNFDSPSVAGRCSCPFKSPPRRSGASCSFLLAEVREAWTLSVRWGGQPAAHTTQGRAGGPGRLGPASEPVAKSAGEVSLSGGREAAAESEPRGRGRVQRPDAAGAGSARFWVLLGTRRGRGAGESDPAPWGA